MNRACLPIVLCAVGALALLWFGYEKDDPERARLTIATTTSTENSGLLRYLLDPWAREHDVQLRVIAVGTGKALALARRGDADLVLVHARAREDAFLAAGHGVDRRDVMWNDFVIVGPPSDPAGVKGMQDAPAALAKIAGAGMPFVSRGDDSGTHIRERKLWQRSGIDPERHEGYHKAGQGMGPCLTMADQLRAYILTDRGTYLAARKGKDLAILIEGDPVLRNPYGAMLVNPARHPHVNARDARHLLDFLTSAEGQRRIGAYRNEGQVLFHPMAMGD